MFTALSPLVIILMALMAIILLMTLMSRRISDYLSRKYGGDYSIAIKIIGFVLTVLLAIIILLIK